MNIILSSSLSAQSNSRILACDAARVLEQDGAPVTLLDLRDYPLPLCDAGPAYDHANVTALSDLLHDATAIIVASPIYNFDGSAALKNVIELTGNRAWENKVVGFLCAAADRASYMSIMSLANSLMLDFRSLIVPRFVYATANAFAGDAIVDPEISRRVAELARATAKLGALLKAA
ncbi:NADPH-dependent FMN reductase [Opitutus terrae]|uniref:NADPH-dependent FMN reductase n=1 Tax=Opitutus terrae (strain DSM 11246 / JCM 15787 / PB90-1) TaxID=452637 RepID=B1ZNP0_OPITP|nr:NAD(P)H-dependent oxidoreductase [Opitutus terrae]ACB75410.1 NADPH-dependent FMN reductase [Opitutus terrae PB90-1]